MADAGAARQPLPEALRPRYAAEPFLTDRMADALVAADLVLGRAGSSTCAELAAVGVASILVPYPYAGAHQRYNARYFSEQGAATSSPTRSSTPTGWCRGPALRDDAARGHGGGRATLGMPDAATALAAELMALGRAPAGADGGCHMIPGPRQSSASTPSPSSAGSSCGPTCRWLR